MGTSTESESIKAAKKNHRCSWCGQQIDTGQPYERWRWFDGGDASTVKVHPECCLAVDEWAQAGGEEFSMGDSPRGCTCGFDKDCERCSQLKMSA